MLLINVHFNDCIWWTCVLTEAYLRLTYITQYSSNEISHGVIGSVACAVGVLLRVACIHGWRRVCFIFLWMYRNAMFRKWCMYSMYPGIWYTSYPWISLHMLDVFIYVLGCAEYICTDVLGMYCTYSWMSWGGLHVFIVVCIYDANMNACSHEYVLVFFFIYLRSNCQAYTSLFTLSLNTRIHCQKCSIASTHLWNTVLRSFRISGILQWVWNTNWIKCTHCCLNVYGVILNLFYHSVS